MAVLSLPTSYLGQQRINAPGERNLTALGRKPDAAHQRGDDTRRVAFVGEKRNVALRPVQLETAAIAARQRLDRRHVCPPQPCPEAEVGRGDGAVQRVATHGRRSEIVKLGIAPAVHCAELSLLLYNAQVLPRIGILRRVWCHGTQVERKGTLRERVVERHECTRGIRRLGRGTDVAVVHDGARGVGQQMRLGPLVGCRFVGRVLWRAHVKRDG